MALIREVRSYCPNLALTLTLILALLGGLKALGHRVYVRQRDVRPLILLAALVPGRKLLRLDRVVGHLRRPAAAFGLCALKP